MLCIRRFTDCACAIADLHGSWRRRIKALGFCCILKSQNRIQCRVIKRKEKKGQEQFFLTLPGSNCIFRLKNIKLCYFIFFSGLQLRVSFAVFYSSEIWNCCISFRTKIRKRRNIHLFLVHFLLYWCINLKKSINIFYLKIYFT